MAVEPIAAQHAERQVALARRTATELGRLWRLIDRGNIAASWGALLPQVMSVLSTSQATAAASAGVYVDDVLEAQGVTAAAAGRIRPGAFAAIASDGRPLATLLLDPAISTLQLIKQGVPVAQAVKSGAFRLDLITRTQVADAGRTAVGTAIAARPQVTGYVRMIVGATCSRCIILAGRRYEWNRGFKRHPRCDCRHVPVAEDVPDDVSTSPRAYFDSLSRVEQDKAFTKAGAEAIREGADMVRVVNARRGMETAGTTITRVRSDGLVVNERIRRQATTQIGGRDVFTTTEAAGRRPRLMPEAIFAAADGDRKLAIRLLKQHGYIT
ncbi:VG15 protein [Actinoplanes palleronii]|uniref:Capsid maturation protease n=1 Tax=Actinoplanes palleronii TaxID=113570 RepID=A0ABQ4BJ97_9ACTN|nr:hypothetical protein [Actinoplanes palleronii]GIE70743.1 hypothetical protein Apa02nite_068510 [Actinoplanes palleronii]